VLAVARDALAGEHDGHREAHLREERLVLVHAAEALLEAADASNVSRRTRMLHVPGGRVSSRRKRSSSDGGATTVSGGSPVPGT
jgi:hypothetical protein